MQRKQNETYIDYVVRVSELLDQGKISILDWANAILDKESDLYSPENLRRCSVFFRKFLQKYFNEQVDSIKDKDILQRTLDAIKELKKERVKIQTATLDYRNNLRSDARHDMFMEKVVDAIQSLEPIKAKHVHVTIPSKQSGLLCLSDFHAGSTYEMRGIYGEVVNKYNFDIMCDRLWRLIGQIEADDMCYDDLTIAFLGDFFEGILRENSLVKLREPVVDVVIKFSEFLSQWIIELQSRLEIPIRIITIGGNHDIARYLGSKPQFEDENFGKLVVEFLSLRLKNCEDIIVDAYSDFAVANFYGLNVGFQHGEDKDLEETINYFSNLYDVDIQEIYCGHFHRQEYKSIGIADVGDRMCYRIGSVCGVDPFSKKVRKCARASCKFVIYNDDGHQWEKTYYMN